jgi:hypothetical protein
MRYSPAEQKQRAALVSYLPNHCWVCDMPYETVDVLMERHVVVLTIGLREDGSEILACAECYAEWEVRRKEQSRESFHAK